MKIETLIKNRVLSYLSTAVQSYIEEDKQSIQLDSLKIRIEYSRDEKFGDYSSPFAMENKNIFGKAPKDIAEGVIKQFANQPFFSEISFSPPGFINFRIDPKILWSYAKESLVSKDYYAKVENRKKINLEFVSANPTGPMNIVSARSAAYGDALGNLLSSLGHSVHKEFYVNDYGNQVNLLGVAVLLRYQEQKGIPLVFQEEDDGRNLFDLIELNVLPKESYRGEYIKEIAITFGKVETNKAHLESLISAKDWQRAISLLSDYAVEYNLKQQKEDLSLFGVQFDEFFRESSLHTSGEVNKVPERLKREDLSEEQGKLLFLSTHYQDDKDRVIRREDGRPTYLMADIAYHLKKYERGFEELIDIWGPDHYGYIARLKGSMVSAGKTPDSFNVLIAQQVNLIENKEKVKMSKRLGIFQTMRDLLSYLGKSASDVGRYFFLMRSADAPLDFDLDLAKDESDKNPVFYIQYAHARISSIFRELGEASLLDVPVDFNTWGKQEDRIRLLFWVSRFSEEVYDSALTREPHRLTNYLQSLSKSFTRFYGQKENRIKEKTGEERESLLLLCKMVQNVLKEGLTILGISAPDQMSKSEPNV
ncbi:arginyl-tRNA synthetase [Leptospira ryugenii]|uniref:Arginine--tRNA ligase n=1 Tax=Leptospira ryugenii TaxID=1917863 RepID=A0A2P2DVU2_9LEPT|nr:arginine--tRNA ligase [Leptospira ryugenii]GBF48744.1 arginyl-tRNA synthetase [Leptospira ryugenii]